MTVVSPGIIQTKNSPIAFNASQTLKPKSVASFVIRPSGFAQLLSTGVHLVGGCCVATLPHQNQILETQIFIDSDIKHFM